MYGWRPAAARTRVKFAATLVRIATSGALLRRGESGRCGARSSWMWVQPGRRDVAAPAYGMKGESAVIRRRWRGSPARADVPQAPPYCGIYHVPGQRKYDLLGRSTAPGGPRFERGGELAAQARVQLTAQASPCSAAADGALRHRPLTKLCSSIGWLSFIQRRNVGETQSFSRAQESTSTLKFHAGAHHLTRRKASLLITLLRRRCDRRLTVQPSATGFEAAVNVQRPPGSPSAARATAGRDAPPGRPAGFLGRRGRVLAGCGWTSRSVWPAAG